MLNRYNDEYEWWIMNILVTCLCKSLFFNDINNHLRCNSLKWYYGPSSKGSVWILGWTPCDLNVIFESLGPCCGQALTVVCCGSLSWLSPSYSHASWYAPPDTLLWGPSQYNFSALEHAASDATMLADVRHTGKQTHPWKRKRATPSEAVNLGGELANSPGAYHLEEICTPTRVSFSPLYALCLSSALLCSCFASQRIKAQFKFPQPIT